MAYAGFHPYIDAVRVTLKRRQERHPDPVTIGQLDYDVGYEPAIEELKEETSKHGWNLYKPNLRLALIALVATNEVRAREHAAFDVVDDEPRPVAFEAQLHPDAFTEWHQFMNATVKNFADWADEVVDLATTEIRGQYSEEDVFERVRAKMCIPTKSLLNAAVYSLFRQMRLAPAEEPMRQVKSGSVVALYGKTELAESWNNVPLFCLYDLEPDGAISAALVEKARSLSIKAKAACAVLASNKLTATKAALLNASCGVPPVFLLGFGEVVATSDLQESANDFTLADKFGVL
jgi:hypothetical protein